ncbi:hypothetical protein AAFF_G00327930 [Aldrovandia affinis]|uniref:Endonuclease/exonuclease/phosphatase domain-containing protein n=1 Tax=Aldrovandia affinis TaxID=143900 RepID=A0AAD7T9M0_9TELE|nr:hypothetical protein AAFF_G00327930 [Aldrovandia affinis]
MVGHPSRRRSLRTKTTGAARAWLKTVYHLKEAIYYGNLQRKHSEGGGEVGGTSTLCRGKGVEILAVQEHRRVHTDQPINYRRVGGCTFITSSAWRNDAQAATGGVGLMVSPRARKALRRVHPHTNRILSADFEGSPVTTVMSVYSPTNVALIEEVERFYDDLRTAIHHVPAHNFLIILGDFNARLGPEDAPFTYHTNTNRNGEHLTALLTEHELLAANTLFRKRMGKRWTFQDRATSMRRQLDYILVRRKWRKSILNAESEGPQECPEGPARLGSLRGKP